MADPQFFKNGDLTELKYYNSAQPISDILSGQKDEFYSDAYGCFVLGDLLYDNNYTPLANAIPRAVFRESFEFIFEAFITAGSMYSYIDVFKKIFGEDVDITFGVPSPGKLTIDIVAIGFELSPFIARRVEDNSYVFDNVIYSDGDGDGDIVFQTIKGFESEYELKQMLFEMVPDGIYTEITLSLS